MSSNYQGVDVSAPAVNNMISIIGEEHSTLLLNNVSVNILFFVISINCVSVLFESITLFCLLIQLERGGGYVGQHHIQDLPLHLHHKHTTYGPTIVLHYLNHYIIGVVEGSITD